MNDFLLSNAVEILDRRMRQVETSTSPLLDTVRFLDFVEVDDRLRLHVAKIEAEYAARYAALRAHLEWVRSFADETAQTLKALGATEEELTNIELSACSLTGDISPEYNPRSGATRETELLQFLSFPAERLSNLEVVAQIRSRRESHISEVYEWVCYRRTSAGFALVELRKLRRMLIPPPHLTQEERIEFKVDIFGRDKRIALQDAAFNRFEVGESTGAERREQYCSEVRSNLGRLYEAVRESLGTTLTWYQALARYRTRCRWYDRDRLAASVTDTVSGDLISQCEAPLTLDLARYLYDCGLTTWYRSKSGVHELDLADLQSSNPLVVEVKAYKSSKQGRAQIIGAFHQLHAYLQSLAAQYHVREGFIVIFRLGGPLYSIPEVVEIGGFALRPFLVDLAPADSSGSRQPPPSSISIEEILAEAPDPDDSAVPPDRSGQGTSGDTGGRARRRAPVQSEKRTAPGDAEAMGRRARTSSDPGSGTRRGSPVRAGKKQTAQ